MEDAAWSPYDSSFRSPYLAGDPARSEAKFPDMKINTPSGEYSFPRTSSAGLAVLILVVWLRGQIFGLPCRLNG
jgi:hypothetical protein